ncbi:multidrug resistance efflux transporter family protein [Niameybacter massiliensis]|uniref:Multidrug resistance efflux transporter family protein n=1 Tax=Holtiella tumoricola TaxID=3018743 RepID=A0AA42J0Z8_9FIRM|nr:multidrug resistance efflux transporter family protein [Holtiella tumoricola]MDA3731927.1 multidrug resistance efflux transporter family protein [Holtiella tumoricola]
MKKAFILGIISSFFFSFTFILNSQMNISGGSWLWSSSLRFLFMLPLLFIGIVINKSLSKVISEIKKAPTSWLLWSTVGFGLFYAPLSLASQYGSSWLVAGTWQITIIAGALISPFFTTKIKTEQGMTEERNKLPKKFLLISSIILIGIFLMQLEEAKSLSLSECLTGMAPVLVAAFAYPLGNRKMIELCDNKLSTIERVFGMTLCSLPFWLIISLFGTISVGFPSQDQLIQSFIVAIFSGIIATVLFFKATDLVSGDTHKLAIIESTQAGEVIFTLLGSILFSNDSLPSSIAILGLSLVVVGMILNSMSQT